MAGDGDDGGLRGLGLRFLCSAVACSSPLLIVNPIEVTKTRLQLQSTAGAGTRYRGMADAVRTIAASEGLAGLYAGAVASALRESSYAAIRMSIYDPIKRLMGEHRARDGGGGGELPLWKKIAAGSSAGVVGSAVANPTDVVKIRMQSFAGASKYRNAFAAFPAIYRAEGWPGLYRGVGPTTLRAAVLSAAMLPSYDHSKRVILEAGWIETDGRLLHAVCGMISGFAMTVVSSPVDVIKTRYMNAPAGGTYAGVVDCLLATIKADGLGALYKGFVPNYLRLGPHTVMAFFVYEELRKVAGLDPV